MISLLQQTAPAVVENTETVVSTESAEAAGHGADAAHAVAGAADAAHAAAGHAASAPGMPQLDFATFGNQIFWLLVVLAVIYWVLSRIALPRIGGVISDRQGAITGDLMAAEEFKLKAKEAEAAYDKALADARTEANRIIAAAKAEIQAELGVEMQKAEAQIAAKAGESEKAIREIRDQAVTSVTAVARDTAREIVAALGGAVDGDAVDAAVDARVKG